MATVRLLLAAEADIEHALLYTLRTFGVHKYQDYGALIQEALEALGEDSRVGRQREDIGAGAWIYPIGKPGRRARHVILYRVSDSDTVEVLALAHDAMDLPRQWRVRSARPR